MIQRNIFLAAFAVCMFAAGMTSSANAAVIGPVTSSTAIDTAQKANPKFTEVKRWHRRRRHGNGGAALGAFAFGLLLGNALNNDRDYYYYRRSHRGSRCEYWSDRCADNWGYRNNDYYGCLRYHKCD